jgi:hypothetical protein
MGRSVNMKRLSITIAAFVALAVPVSSSSAAPKPKWLTNPTCSATTVALTCSAKATGLKNNDPTWPPMAAIFARVVYTCREDSSIKGFSGISGDPLAVLFIKNGQSFSLTAVPPASPDVLDTVDCPSGNWVRDPSYYFVSVAVAQSDPTNFVLFGDTIPKVSPS